jgi:hypothetical protein
MKTPEEVSKEITRRNLLFEGKTNAEKRVLIAQDVLDQIEGFKINPKKSVYLDIFSEACPNESVREVFLSERPSCQCCALGAIFLSCTLFNNKISFKTLNEEYLMGIKIRSGYKFTNGMNDIFTNKQLALIEFAFEGGTGSFHEYDLTVMGYSEKEIEKAKEYSGTTDTTLKEIMKNIIKNNGEFIP